MSSTNTLQFVHADGEGAALVLARNEHQVDVYRHEPSHRGGRSGRFTVAVWDAYPTSSDDVEDVAALTAALTPAVRADLGLPLAA